MERGKKLDEHAKICIYAYQCDVIQIENIYKPTTLSTNEPCNAFEKIQIFNERLQSLFISIDKWVMLKKTKGNRTLGQQQTTFFCSIVLSG